MTTIILSTSNSTPQLLSSLLSKTEQQMTVHITVTAKTTVHLIDDLLRNGVHECGLTVAVEAGGSCKLEMRFLCPRLLHKDGCPHQLPHRCPPIMRTILLQHLGAGATTELAIRFAGSLGRTLHLQTVQHHLASNTNSEMSLQSVLANGATVTCNSLIAIEAGLHGVIAHQKSRLLLLDDKITTKIAPKLEIKSRDVACNHSSAIGKAKLHDVWYCTTRGINPEQTMQLLTNAFLR